MVRLVSILSLAGLLLGTTAQVHGDAISSDVNSAKARNENSLMVDAIARHLAESTLVVTNPRQVDVIHPESSMNPEVIKTPGTSALSVSVESIASRSTDPLDGVVNADGASLRIASTRFVPQPRRNPVHELAYIASSARLRISSDKFARSRPAIFALFGTGFVGIFFRTRILRERRAPLAIPG